MKETIITYGHENVLATHKTTIEITKDSELTKQGDCIIGVNSSKACADLSEEIKQKLKTNCKVEVVLKVDNLEERITGYGSPNIILTNSKDIVIRKSDYIDDRTLMIKIDKSCADLSREFVEKLKNPNQTLLLIIETKSDSV